MNQARDRSNSTSGALRAASALLFCAAAAALSFSESPAQVPPQGTTPDYDSALCEQLGGTLETSENEEVCSNLDANDTFCIIGSADALPCRGLFKHVIKCNAEYNRPALNPFFCGEKCDEAFGEDFSGKARGLRCERVISANAAVSVSFPSSPAATIYASEGYAGAVGAAKLSLGYTLNFNPPDAARFTIFESSGDVAVTLLPPGLLSPATLLLTAEIVCADCYPLDPLTLGAVFVPVVAPPQDFFNADAGQPLTGVTFNLPSLEDYPGLSNPVFTDADTGDNFVIDNDGNVTGTAGSTPPETLRGYWTADGMLGTLTLALASAAVLEFAPAALIVMEGPGARFHNAGLALSHSPPADATFRVSLRFPSQDAVGAGDVTRFRFNGADAVVSDPSFEITLTVGEREAMLEFEVEDDEIFETPEGFFLELERINGDGVRAGDNAVRAVTLVDPISLAARMTVGENEGTATVTVMLGNDRPASDITVGLLYGGAADSGDYKDAPASVVVTAGETSAEFNFGLLDDIDALEHLDTVTFQGGYTDLRISVDTIGFAGVQRDIYMNLPEARPEAVIHIEDDDTLILNLEQAERVPEGSGGAQACVTFSNPFALNGNPGGLALWVREWDGTSSSAGNRLKSFRLRSDNGSKKPTHALDFYEENGERIEYRYTPLNLKIDDTQVCADVLLPPIDDKPGDMYYAVEFGWRDLNTALENIKFGESTLSFVTIYDAPVDSLDLIALFPFQHSSSPRVATVYAPKGHTGANDNILEVEDDYDYTLTFTPPGGTLFALSPSTSEDFESSNDYAIELLSPGLLAPATLQLTAEFTCADCLTLSTTLQAVYIPISTPSQTAYRFTSGTALSGVTFNLPSLDEYPGISRVKFRDAGDRGNFDVSVSYEWNGSAGAYVAEVTGTLTGSSPITVRGLWTATGMLGTLILELTLTPPETAAANPERENAVPPSADFSAVLCGADNCQNASVSPVSPVSFPSSERVKQSPNQKIKAPRAAAPAAACVAGRSAGQHMLPQPPSEQTATAPRPLCVVPKLRACDWKNPPNKKPEPLVQPLPRRHAWLAAPAANTCSRNRPQNKRQQRPALSVSFPSSERVKQSPKPKPPRAVSPEAARRRMTTPGHVKESPKQKTRTPVSPEAARRRMTCGARSHQRSRRAPMRGIWAAPRPFICANANTCSRNRPQNKQQQRPALSVSFPSSERVKQSPKPKPPRAVSPEAARRRMTTPVVNTPQSDTGAIPKEKKPSSFRNFHFAQAEGKYPESPPQGGHDSPLERMRSAASQDTARRRG